MTRRMNSGDRVKTQKEGCLMKKWFGIWVVILLLGISQSVRGGTDYTEFNGDFSIFSLGDSQAVLQDKIAFLESRGRLVRVVPDETGILLEYLQEPGDKKSTNLFFVLKEDNGAQNVHEIIVSRYFATAEQWRAFAQNSLATGKETFGKPLKLNPGYLKDLTEKSACSIAIWQVDDSFVALGGTAKPEENAFRFMLTFSVDLVWGANR